MLMYPLINGIEIILCTVDIPVGHGLPWQCESPSCGRGSRAVRHQGSRYDSFYNCAIAIFFTFRADDHFLFIYDTFLFDGGYAELLTDFCITDRDRFSITVFTEMLFLWQGDGDISYQEVHIEFILFGFGFPPAGMAFYFRCCRFLRCNFPIRSAVCFLCGCFLLRTPKNYLRNFSKVSSRFAFSDRSSFINFCRYTNVAAFSATRASWALSP